MMSLVVVQAIPSAQGIVLGENGKLNLQVDRATYEVDRAAYIEVNAFDGKVVKGIIRSSGKGER